MVLPLRPSATLVHPALLEPPKEAVPRVVKWRCLLYPLVVAHAVVVISFLFSAFPPASTTHFWAVCAGFFVWPSHMAARFWMFALLCGVAGLETAMRLIARMGSPAFAYGTHILRTLPADELQNLAARLAEKIGPSRAWQLLEDDPGSADARLRELLRLIPNALQGGRGLLTPQRIAVERVALTVGLVLCVVEGLIATRCATILRDAVARSLTSSLQSSLPATRLTTSDRFFLPRAVEAAEAQLDPALRGRDERPAHSDEDEVIVVGDAASPLLPFASPAHRLQRREC